MTCSRVTASTRNEIWIYQPGPTRDEHSARFPEFVEQHLQFGEGLQVSRSVMEARYLQWVNCTFGLRLRQPDRQGDMHNLYRHLLCNHCVDEDDPFFRGVALRPQSP